MVERVTILASQLRIGEALTGGLGIVSQIFALSGGPETAGSVLKLQP